MGLIVNNVRYTAPLSRVLLDTILKALNNLSCPELIPMEIANIKQGELPLCMQREMLYIDRTNPRHTTRYIGTKSVDSCVIAYFYNDIEHLTIHFDHSVDIDLAAVLAKLHDNQNLKLMLMGAGFGFDNSITKLTNVLELIYNAAQKLNINIEVTAQKLLDRNKLTLSDKQSFLFDVLLTSATIICQQYFNCKLDYELFSFDRVSEFTTNKPGKQRIDADFLLLLPQIFRLYEKGNKHVNDKLDAFMKAKFVTKEAFYAAIDAILTPIGFNYLDCMYVKLNAFRSQSLNNFAIDLTTKKLAVISREITSRYEMASLMVTNPHVLLDKGYRYVCDEITDDVIPPPIDPTFVEKCVRIQPAVLSRSIDSESFHQALGLKYDISYLDYHVKFVENVPANVTRVNQFSFFRPLAMNASDYCNDINETTTLRLLEEITKKLFTAKMRKVPSHVVDAFCQCDSTNDAAKIQFMLQERKIQTQHYVDADKLSYVCVPGINVGQKARRIANAAGDVIARASIKLAI